LSRRPHELSGGERQRVALGRAIVRSPRLFLLDEPLASIDPRLRLELRQELKQLQERVGVAMIFVTHDQEEAVSMGQRIMVIAAGRMQQFATPREMYAAPANRFVAGFVGSLPMNFLEGRMELAQGIAAFSRGTMRVPLAGEQLSAAQNDQTVVLGVRPEHLAIGDAVAGKESLVGLVQSVEDFGDHQRVFVELAEHRDATRWLVRASAQIRISPGDTIGLTVDVRNAHVFEAGEFGPAVRGAGRAGKTLGQPTL
jgi:multiple sugar transport system ATP-binding protein